jgi:TolB-like protein
MKFTFIVLLAALVSVPCLPVAAQIPDKPSLLSITLKSGTTVVGEVRSENAATLVVFDLNTGDEKTIKVADIKTRTPVPEAQATSRVGLPRFLAWRVKKELNGPATGKIAEVTPSAIYLTLGSKDGIEVGNTLSVFRDEGDLKDPDTGDVIGKKRAKLAKLEVIEVQESYCKAKRLGDSEVELKAKDVVEQEGGNLAVAIMPILDIDGDETTAGKTLAEQISTVFISQGITVVERERLDVALKELSLQQKKAFDPEAAQKVGKQLGAVAVVTGTITPKNKRAEAHVRLVRVQTGEAVVAASQVMGAVGEKVAGGTNRGPKSTVVAGNNETALFRKKFSAGKVLYNSKTGELTLGYDFKKPDQLKDFDLNMATLSVNNGVLRIGPAENIVHVVKFESVSIAAWYTIENAADKRALLSLSPGGVSLRYHHFNGLQMSICHGDTELAVKHCGGDSGRIGPWPKAIRFDLSHAKAFAKIGNFEVGAPVNIQEVGNVAFHGGTGGVKIGSLAITGIPDKEWLKDFLSQ